MAHALADRGELELLAVVQNTATTQGVGVVSVLNHYYGRDGVPIGAYGGGDLKGHTSCGYVADLVEHWPSPIKNSSQARASLDVYRQVLAAQADGSVTISSIRALVVRMVETSTPLLSSQILMSAFNQSSSGRPSPSSWVKRTPG